jgi:asparagine synthase (glutamine-hydrolysing)
MCGIAGALSLSGAPIPGLAARLERMSELIAHRGPDGSGIWISDDQTVGLAHVRLAVIDVGASGAQPMLGPAGTVISFNGEIYNYRELRELGVARGFPFETRSDTETILSQYMHGGLDSLSTLWGMFAFALWDPVHRRLILTRDRVGIKPLYYTIVDDILYFASEVKALVPFLHRIETDPDALSEYLTFQYLLGDRTLFASVKQVMPGHALTWSVDRGFADIRYWDVEYNIDYEHTEGYFLERLCELVEESMDMHVRSDVEIGAYVSGGIDSSLIGRLAADREGPGLKAFHGRFPEPAGYDESTYAEAAVEAFGGQLYVADIGAEDFERDIRRVIYQLDYPVAGPGSFPQFEVSSLARSELKVVLGGQGGDEIFGGYARYLVAYLEQCLRAAIDGTAGNGNFVVTLESMLPNLGVLQEYQPLLQQFWREGLFGPLDERFFRLIDRGNELAAEVRWDALDMGGLRDRYMATFNSTRNVRKEAYFDSMTHFEFKTLLPALLHVEDRMSMAHGLESRVPLLDHRIVEFAATVPADIKFKDGKLKRMLKKSFKSEIPPAVRHRRDKMGFPVPLTEWFAGPLKTYADGVFESLRDRDHAILDGQAVLAGFQGSPRFSRKAWGLLSLELWMQEFHDRADEWRWPS